MEKRTSNDKERQGRESLGCPDLDPCQAESCAGEVGKQEIHRVNVSGIRFGELLGRPKSVAHERAQPGDQGPHSRK